MHVRILPYSLGNLTSGQARFARILAGGLRKVGVDVSIRSAWSSREALAQLSSSGIDASSLRVGSPSATRQAIDILLPRRLLKDLSAAATRDGKADWVLVLSDELVGAGPYLGDRQRNAYISNGDFMVLFFNDAFYRNAGIGMTLASWTASSVLRSHANAVRSYDLFLGNSVFTKNFMSYLYGVPCQGVCYPPVDFDLFHPRAPKASPPFVLTLARNLREQGVQTLERIAREVPLKVVGGLQVRGATALGVVGDSALAELYSRATIVVSAVVSEFYGYSVAEALACGTPVVSYSVCGPGELVRDGVNGWVVDSSEALIATTVRRLKEGIPAGVVSGTLSSASSYQDVEVARGLKERLAQSL